MVSKVSRNANQLMKKLASLLAVSGLAELVPTTAEDTHGPLCYG